MTANNEFPLRHGGVVTYHADGIQHKLTFETTAFRDIPAYDSIVLNSRILEFYRWLGKQLVEAGVLNDS